MVKNGMMLLLLAMLSSQARAHCMYAADSTQFNLGQFDLGQLCSVKPTSDAAACTIFNECNNATLSPPLSPSVCNVSVLATEFCLDDEAIVGKVDYCSRYINHINITESGEGNSMESCWEELGVAQAYSIPTTDVVRQAAFNSCQAMGGVGNMPGCDTCVNATASGCPNPFLKLAQGCVAMDMPGCKTGGWRAWCAKEAAVNGQVGAGAPALCLNAAQQAALASSNTKNSAQSVQLQWNLMALLMSTLCLLWL